MIRSSLRSERQPVGQGTAGKKDSSCRHQEMPENRQLLEVARVGSIQLEQAARADRVRAEPPHDAADQAGPGDKGLGLYLEDQREPPQSMTRDNETVRCELQKDYFNEENGGEPLEVRRPIKTLSASSAREQGGPEAGSGVRGIRAGPPPDKGPSEQRGSSSGPLSAARAPGAGTTASKRSPKSTLTIKDQSQSVA